MACQSIKYGAVAFHLPLRPRDLLEQHGRKTISKSGRTGKRVHHDDPEDDTEFVAVEDDEPDAPTSIPTIPTQPFTTIAVPELTHPGESASNGLAERAARTLEEKTRTRLTTLKARINITIPSINFILGRIVNHTSYVLNKYQPGSDDKRTPFARLHGNETNEKLDEFGKTHLWFVPKSIRSN